MARKNGRSSAGRRRVRDEEVREYDVVIRYASAIVLLAAGLLLALSLFGAAGPVGAAVFKFSYAVVGIGAFLLPFALIAVGFYAGFGQPVLAPLTASGMALIVAAVLSFAGVFGGSFGGDTGSWIGRVLAGFFGFWGALVLLVAALAVGVAIVSDIEALVELLGENVTSLWQRWREPRSEDDEEELPKRKKSSRMSSASLKKERMKTRTKRRPKKRPSMSRW